MLCTSCGGKSEACDACKGRGQIAITSCPRKQITANIWDMIELAHFAMDGAWPVSGGTLEQSASFIDAVRQIKSEDSYWKAKFKING